MGGLYVDARAGIWNPLEDDGDALRLAVKLNMRVDCLCAAETYCARAKRGNDWVDEDAGSDPYAATRRAIVRAAAAMGAA